MTDSNWVVRCEDLSVELGGVRVLESVTMGARSGEVLGIRGASGSGKSTLLHVLAGLVSPSSGRVTFEGVRVDDWSDRRRSAMRLRSVGVVFQASDLIPELTIGENVALPLRLLGTSKREAAAQALTHLASVGIEDLAGRRLDAVSGGQLQRAAIARALVHQPTLVLADEPTGALDDTNAHAAMQAMLTVVRGLGVAAVVVTHDSDVADMCDRLVHLESGRIVDDADIWTAT